MKGYFIAFSLVILNITIAKADDWKASWPLSRTTNNYDKTEYHDFGNFNWGDFPVYTNKVFAYFPNGSPLNTGIFVFRKYDPFRTQYTNPTLFRPSESRNVQPKYSIDGDIEETFSVPNSSSLYSSLGVHRVQLLSHWTRFRNGDLEEENTTVYSSFTYIIETPEWKNLDEIKKICNSSTNNYLLSEHFSVSGVTFYLDNINTTPITIFSALNITPGFHKLIAKKYYDNATSDNNGVAKGGDLLIEFSFEVLESMPITITSTYPTSVCKNSSIFTISASPLNGTWTGNGIDNNGNFNPEFATVGNNNLTYSYTNSVTGCITTKLIQIAIRDIPKVTVDQPSFSVCESVTSYRLPTGSPAGGVWSGEDPGYFSSPISIDPSKMKAGPNVFKYAYHDGSCPNSAAFTLTVNEKPKLTLMNDFYSCTNGAKVSLNAQPTGGFWQGVGIDNNQGAFFDPSVMQPGVSSLSYTYTDANSCTSTSTIKATVIAAPPVTVMNDTAICESAGTLALKATPAGGVWSGQGVIGSNFDPTKSNIGNSSVNYLYTDPTTKCYSNAGVNILVKGKPGQISITGDTVACLNGNVRLAASGTNVTDFNWHKGSETTPFATGNNISYRVTHNETLTVSPRIVNAGDCPAPGKPVNVVMNSPVGSIKSLNSSDTVSFGGLFQGLATFQNAVGYRWDFGDGGYSLQQAGNHYYYNPGNKTVSLTATGSTGCTTTLTLQNKIYVLPETGKAPEPNFTRGSGYDSSTRALSVYPTVFKDRLTVEFYLQASQEVFIQFFDQRGRLVKTDKRNSTAGRNKIIYDNVNTELPGHGVYYFVKINSPELKDVTEKIIKL